MKSGSLNGDAGALGTKQVSAGGGRIGGRFSSATLVPGLSLLGFDPKGTSLLFCARDSLVTTRWDKARKSNKPNPDAFPLLCKLVCVLILLPEPCRSPRWLAKSLRRLQATWPEASLEAPSPVSHQFRHGGGSQGVLLPNFWSG